MVQRNGFSVVSESEHALRNAVLQPATAGLGKGLLSVDMLNKLWDFNRKLTLFVSQFREVLRYNPVGSLGVSIRSASEVVLQTFRNDGEGHIYQFEIRNYGPEMTESKVISKNSCVKMELTDRLDTATCTHTLLSTDVYVRTDHVRYTLRYLHCFSVVTYPYASDSALNIILNIHHITSQDVFSDRDDGYPHGGATRAPKVLKRLEREKDSRSQPQQLQVVCSFAAKATHAVIYVCLFFPPVYKCELKTNGASLESDKIFAKSTADCQYLKPVGLVRTATRGVKVRIEAVFVSILVSRGEGERDDFSCAAQQLNASQSTHRFSFVNHTIKTVNMPKVRHSVNLKSKLTSYISEFKEDGLSTDNKILFCNLCQCAVSSTQKFLVQQHITTSKHQANKQLNSKQRQLFLTQPTTSNVRSEFNIDLCRSLISADIPLYKLKNKVFRNSLKNILNIQSRMSQHLGRRMLHPSTMRQYRR
ncbi:hypothetical protein ANN_19911 [Periplaneta americana]|uniref:Uncharacterized protein n=1 Tax=Periplaneta americana TaxID=6978 RepID=A0ABQ8SBR9_PERAM|nr:hypothetical protein ANN_19911 [Periplaneta americana]